MNSDFFQAKSEFRISIKLANKSETIKNDLYCRIYVNFGNLLDESGRCFEAIYFYDKALKRDPGFGEALGNKGITLARIAPYMRGFQHIFYLESFELLSKSVKSNISLDLEKRLVDVTFFL